MRHSSSVWVTSKVSPARATADCRNMPEAAAKPAAGALPNTGATQGLELLGLAGLTLLVAGGLTVGLRRREARG